MKKFGKRWVIRPMEVDGFLKKHQVWLEYTVEDYEREIESSRQLREKRRQELAREAAQHRERKFSGASWRTGFGLSAESVAGFSAPDRLAGSQHFGLAPSVCPVTLPWTRFSKRIDASLRSRVRHNYICPRKFTLSFDGRYSTLEG